MGRGALNQVPDNMDRELSRKRRVLFVSIILLVSLGGGLIGSEAILRYRSRFIRDSNRLDPGLILYDERLGWRLAPGREGRHRHHDFDVRYATNRYGFRGDFRMNQGGEGLRYAFVGDSFTFSFGVGDHETFVAILNSKATGGGTFLNFGVPGYSTDQEYLLIRERVFSFRPDVILLVVYLAGMLRKRHRNHPGKWFYPNEGHMTPEGHRIVADILGPLFSDVKKIGEDDDGG